MKSNVLSGGRAYYSSRDLARMFSVNESTIRRWENSAKLKCQKTLGHHRRFSRDQIREFIAVNHTECIVSQSNEAQNPGTIMIDDLKRRAG